ncbi:AsnC family transcriptional regulator [Actinomadura fulvescens]|uniref:AsnC family transcriptional regulator n=1 Tax=Actinomadura fulvescens TaxID=46160 RepID=A0ABP6CBC8_9ACTN
MKPDLQDSGRLDELDLALIHTLQISPRAPWAAVGKALAVDPVTAARRWQRLTDSGVAWVTTYPLLTPEASPAIVEFECEPGRAEAVAEELAADPQALIVEVTSGTRDVLATVCAPTATLPGYLLRRVGRIAGVRRVAHYPITAVHAEGSTWRVGALDKDTETELGSGETTTSLVPPQTPRLDDIDWALCDRLAADGRLAVTEIARSLGIGEATARRHLNRLTKSGVLKLRCEVARAASPWPAFVWYLARTRAEDLAKVVRSLAARRERLSVTQIVGPANLLLGFALRPADLVGFESRLTARLPALEIVDRRVVQRQVRLFGRTLDARGFAGSAASIDIRRTPPAPS